MNSIDLANKRDFPLTTSALQFMQTAFGMFEQLAALGGNDYVVSGCVITGSSASSGYVVLNGKLMPFNAGTIQANVKVVKTVQNVPVNEGTRKETTYHAEFGTGGDYQITWDTLNGNRFDGLVGMKPRMEATEALMINHTSSINDHETRIYLAEADIAVLEYNQAGVKNKIIPIIDWDMQTDKFYNVAHGLDANKIISLSVVIKTPGELSVHPLDGIWDNHTSPAGSWRVTDTEVKLVRNDIGYFNFPDCNNSSGFISIQYTA